MSSKPVLRADAARNVERMVKAAHELFSSGRYDASMEEIAGAAGVGVATLYRRFPTREDLIRAVLERQLTEPLTLVIEEVRSEPDLYRALSVVLEAAMSAAVRERGTLTAAANAGAVTLDLAQRLFEPMGDLLRRGQEAGVFRRDLVAEDIPRLQLMLLGTLPSFEPGSDGWRRYQRLLMDTVSTTDQTSPPLPPAMPLRELLTDHPLTPARTDDPSAGHLQGDRTKFRSPSAFRETE